MGKFTKLVCITVENDNINEDITHIFYNIGYNIKQKKVTLDNLQELQKLKGDTKKEFLEYLKKEVSNDELHELNKKVMEHAIDLVDSEDSAFLLRRPSEDSIFRDLFYLEAKKNSATVEINDENTLTINFSGLLFNLYQPLIDNFYRKKWEDIECQKSFYKISCKNFEISFEDLSNNYKEAFESYYIKYSLARSIICLFISRIFREESVINYNINDNNIKENSLIVVDKNLIDSNGIYVNSLKGLDILNSIGALEDNEFYQIKILGTVETVV